MIDFINPIYVKTDNEILMQLGKRLKQMRINNNEKLQIF